MFLIDCWPLCVAGFLYGFAAVAAAASPNVVAFEASFHIRYGHTTFVCVAYFVAVRGIKRVISIGQPSPPLLSRTAAYYFSDDSTIFAFKKGKRQYEIEALQFRYEKIGRDREGSFSMAAIDILRKLTTKFLKGF